MAVWNALLVIAALLLIALVGEAYFRLTRPFIDTRIPSQFVEGVGLIREPNSELRHAEWNDDNFVVSRANSLGFLDREPISAERAAEGCHIAFIGDSYVEAREVAIADKFHVRLEEMAARKLPHLDVTTQAYGILDTGQINQLPFYDEYARRLNPKLVMLVFFLNDFMNNSPALHALSSGAAPDRMPYMSAQRDEYGVMKLRPPDAEYERFLLPRLPKRWHESARDRLSKVSYFAKWLSAKNVWGYNSGASQISAWASMIADRPCCSSLTDGWRLSWYRMIIGAPFKEEKLPPFLEEALEYTAFGMDEFKQRTDRDGANLAILAASRHMGRRGDSQFDRLSAIAEARGIPVISYYDYIVRQGYNPMDARWRYDFHWNPTGHQWVAAAVLEWLKANRGVCE